MTSSSCQSVSMILHKHTSCQPPATTALCGHKQAAKRPATHSVAVYTGSCSKLRDVASCTVLPLPGLQAHVRHEPLGSRRVHMLVCRDNPSAAKIMGRLTRGQPPPNYMRPPSRSHGCFGISPPHCAMHALLYCFPSMHTGSYTIGQAQPGNLVTGSLTRKPRPASAGAARTASTATNTAYSIVPELPAQSRKYQRDGSRYIRRAYV